MSFLLRLVGLLAGLSCLSFRLGLSAVPVRFEWVTLDAGGPAATVSLQWCPGTAARHPVILMLGALDSNAPPRLEHEPRPRRLDALRLLGRTSA